MIRIIDNFVLTDVKVVPSSSKTQIAYIKDGRLRIKIAAAPEDGKANACLIDFFSKLLHCPKRDIAIKTGEKSRLKTLMFPISLKPEIEKIYNSFTLNSQP